MQLFLDTADVDVLRELYVTGLVDGVTTNPSLIAKGGRNFLEVIAEIAAFIDGPISAEVAATDTDGMLNEGRVLAAISPNVVVKLPLTFEGLQATAEFAAEGIGTNVTLCFSTNQALLAAKAGATFVSPFIGRLEDIGENGVALIEEIRTVFDLYQFETAVLAASIRNPDHIRASALAGAHCATLPPAVFRELVKHPLTEKGLQQFAEDWAGTGQSIL